jgi:hypothetical protein
MAASYDPAKYKISTMQSFLTRNLDRGPFRSTAGLTKAAGIQLGR